MKVLNTNKELVIMKTASLTKEVIYKEGKPNIQALLETPFSKEIRIVFKAGQIMKEHTAPGAIVVEMFEGEIDFGVEGEVHRVTKGDLLTLDAKVPHDLKAIKDSIVRLTLAKTDNINRVFSVVKD
ncbi:cupin domain-containing protein [Saccharicrinis aurantiacus]|uniref:cupin domain-containing protein n=1 Tax=Saccharicrinis aurantiacus TaxID=1849719 RepID=UPI00248FE458|nr:cupin domain-containing protein [Saccharicrinis aurantiacus]